VCNLKKRLRGGILRENEPQLPRSGVRGVGHAKLTPRKRRDVVFASAERHAEVITTNVVHRDVASAKMKPSA
jgi:hypothetical protein